MNFHSVYRKIFIASVKCIALTNKDVNEMLQQPDFQLKTNTRSNKWL